MTIATDGAAMYLTEVDKVAGPRLPGGFGAVEAAETFGQYVLGAGTDDLLELTPAERERIFNLGYFTWVEQQGVAVRRLRRPPRPGLLARPAGERPRLGRRDRGDERAGRGRGGRVTDARREPPPPRTVAALPTALVCAGCGHRVPDDAPLAFACPAARPGDDVDHVLVRRAGPGGRAVRRGRRGDPNPYVRWRTRFHA